MFVLVLALGQCQYKYRHVSTSMVIYLVPVRVLFVVANGAITSTGIFSMPIPVLASLLQQCQTDMEHIIIANTSMVIHMMPVLVIFIFANRANTSTGIFFMPILVLVFSQCLYRYWHPFSNNASSGTEHVRYQYRHLDIVNTSTVINVMPVLVILIFANRANTSTGIFFIPILVLILSFTMPIPVWSYIS